MSEQTAPTTGTEETNGQNQDGKEFQAITSQEDFDKAIQARIARERSKFSDYDDLKAKADRFAEWEEAQKSEAQEPQKLIVPGEGRSPDLPLNGDGLEESLKKALGIN